MSESPGTGMVTPSPRESRLDAGATPEERLRTLAPAAGWGRWLGAVLRDELISAVRAGSIDGDVAKKAAEHFVEHRSATGFLDAVALVHDLAFQYPELDHALRPVRAQVIEYVEPLVAEQAATAIRAGRDETVVTSVHGFLQLAARYVDGHVEPALLANALERLLNGGAR